MPIVTAHVNDTPKIIIAQDLLNGTTRAWTRPRSHNEPFRVEIGSRVDACLEELHVNRLEIVLIELLKIPESQKNPRFHNL